jgi:hypothetical protein
MLIQYYGTRRLGAKIRQTKKYGDRRRWNLTAPRATNERHSGPGGAKIAKMCLGVPSSYTLNLVDFQ